MKQKRIVFWDRIQLQYINQSCIERLKNIKGIHIAKKRGQTVANYSYFPILLEADYPLGRNELYQKLKEHNIFARRYFYPLISDFPMYRGLSSDAPSHLPVAADVANKVICLPHYPLLKNTDVQKIINMTSEVN